MLLRMCLVDLYIVAINIYFNFLLTRGKNFVVLPYVTNRMILKNDKLSKILELLLNIHTLSN